MSVVVRVKVNSKQISNHWTKDEATGKPKVNTTVNMNTVYTNDPNNPNFIFSVMSGGTKFELQTINDNAADEFELDGEYECVFTRVK
ncbi:MAG TPA: hypothetical protein VKU83_06045 [Puia sp.]|nr:hypothetical protein [Puia sp.]